MTFVGQAQTTELSSEVVMKKDIPGSNVTMEQLLFFKISLGNWKRKKESRMILKGNLIDINLH